MPKISVVIPVYNTAPYLRECLDSVINQTLKDIEIILVDDGSTDGSLGILLEYAAADPRILVIEQKNQGAGTARNRGLAIAQGTYLCFLDSDDFFELEMLEACFEKLEAEQSDIVIFKTQNYDIRTGKTSLGSWNPYSVGSPFSPEDVSKYIFQTSRIATWDKVFRRAFILKHKLSFQKIHKANDIYFSCLAMVLARKLSLLPEVFTNYRIGMQTNLQAKKHIAPNSFWSAWKKVKKTLMEQEIYEKYEQSFLNQVINSVQYELNSAKKHPTVYFEIYDLVKRNAEREFAFLKHPQEYYFYTTAYAQYRSMIGGNTKRSNAAEALYDKAIVVYGTGLIAQSLIPYLLQVENIDLVGVCTSDTMERGVWTHQGIEHCIRSIQEWKMLAPNAVILIATLEREHVAITENCRRAGFEDIVPVWEELMEAAYGYEYKKMCEKYESELALSIRGGDKH